MVGIKDVARQAGVSVGTVSNVINRPDMVSEETRHRVQSVIDRLGYVRSESARQLRAGQQPHHRAARPRHGQPLLRGRRARRRAGRARRRARRDGLQQRAEPRRRGRLPRALRRTAGARRPAHPGRRHRPQPRRLPPARASPSSSSTGSPRAPPSARSPSTTYAGGALAVRHLARHRAPLHRLRQRPAAPQPGQGPPGRRAAARSPRRACPPTRCANCPPNASTWRRAATRAPGSWGSPSAPPPSSAPTTCWPSACCRPCTPPGCGVPEDMAIVGYDDIEFAAAAAVPLTSVRQPAVTMGAIAAELLLEETGGGSPPSGTSTGASCSSRSWWCGAPA